MAIKNTVFAGRIECLKALECRAIGSENESIGGKGAWTSEGGTEGAVCGKRIHD